MFQKIANALSVEVEGVDLTKASNLEFYVRQGCTFFLYTPTVVDETHLLVKIPYEDAMRLRPPQAKLQLALTDEGGNRRATVITEVSVLYLLKEDGYD